MTKLFFSSVLLAFFSLSLFVSCSEQTDSKSSTYQFDHASSSNNKSEKCTQQPIKRRKINRTDEFIFSESEEFLDPFAEVDDDDNFLYSMNESDFINSDILISLSGSGSCDLEPFNQNDFDVFNTFNPTSSSSGTSFSSPENIFIDIEKINFDLTLTPEASGSTTPLNPGLISPSATLRFPETPDTNFSGSSTETNESMKYYNVENVAQRAPISYKTVLCSFEGEEDEVNNSYMNIIDAMKALHPDDMDDWTL